MGSTVHPASRRSLIVSCSSSKGFTGDSESLGEGHSNWEARFQQQQPEPLHRSPDPGHGPPSSSPSSSASARPLDLPGFQSWDFSPEPFVPSPSNLPTNEDGEQWLYPPRNMRQRRKDLWTLTDQPGVDLFLAGPEVWRRMCRVYVVLFGVGERDTEGIYSLRAYGSDGTPHETIIAFESEEEAQRYACLLEASMEHRPHVCAIPPRELLTFCLDHRYACRLEPRGSLLIPPESNVSMTDWERSLRLRDGKFAVLDVEPELLGAAATATAAPPPPAAAPATAAASASTLARYSGLSGAELEEVRARLESLLRLE